MPEPPQPPSAADTISAVLRGSGKVSLDGISAEQLREYELARELREARDRIRALEGAIKTTAKVLAPYAGGNGR